MTRDLQSSQSLINSSIAPQENFTKEKMKNIMQYQVVWTSLDGQTHRGQLNSDRSIPEAWVDRMNAKYPDIYHYVADVYPAYASRAVSKN